MTKRLRSLADLQRARDQAAAEFETLKGIVLETEAAMKAAHEEMVALQDRATGEPDPVAASARLQVGELRAIMAARRFGSTVRTCETAALRHGTFGSAVALVSEDPARLPEAVRDVDRVLTKLAELDRHEAIIVALDRQVNDLVRRIAASEAPLWPARREFLDALEGGAPPSSDGEFIVPEDHR